MPDMAAALEQQYVTPPEFRWMYRKRTRPDDMDVIHEDGGGEDQEDGFVDCKEQRPYCYLCAVSSTPSEPNEWRDKIMLFARTQIRELAPDFLCECISTFYDNSVLAEVDGMDEEDGGGGGGAAAIPRAFTPEAVYQHFTRHMIDPHFTAARAVRTLMQYDDAFTKTMHKIDADGNALPPHAENTKVHLKVLQQLTREVRELQKNH
jgi:hypothetical protein